MPSLKTKKSKTKEAPKPKYCPGVGQKPDGRSKTKVRKWSPAKYQYVYVDKYKCPYCLRQMSLDSKGLIYRHAPPPSTEELEAKRIENERVLQAKELKRLRKEGKIYGLCAECEIPLFEADYLCGQCRA